MGVGENKWPGVSSIADEEAANITGDLDRNAETGSHGGSQEQKHPKVATGGIEPETDGGVFARTN